jgi:hypothetical protein
MYSYHSERRSRFDKRQTVQDCKCSISCLGLEKQLTELQPFRWSTTLSPISMAFLLLLHTSLSCPVASPAHRQVKKPNMSTLALPWIPWAEQCKVVHSRALLTPGGMASMPLHTTRREDQADSHASYDPQLNDSPPAWNQGQIPLIFEAPVATPNLAPPTSQSASTAATPVPSHNSPEPSLPPTTIGYIQGGDDYVFRCSRPACRNKRFGRWADLKRHVDAFHEAKGNVLWCPVPTCARSEAFGNKPFSTTRRDKLKEHVQRMHC